MSRVLVLGARGLLGTSLCPILAAKGHQILRQSRRPGLDLQFNPSDVCAWHAILSNYQPDIVINLAAATDVDRCESHPQWAYDANVSPVTSFVRGVREAAVEPHFVQISTDQLYNGDGPHVEDAVRPCNVYALTKLTAELALLNCSSTILRTNFFGASRTPERCSFSDWVVSSLRACERITVFNDVLFSALHLDYLCEIISQVILSPACGTFNFGTRDGISKADFAFELAHQLGLSTDNMQIGSLAERKLRAKRPLDMRLNSSRFETTFHASSPTMSDQIKKTAQGY